MTPYTAADMLNKMQGEHGLDPVTERTGHTAAKRPGHLRRAIASLLGAKTPH